LILKNCVEYYELLFGCWHAGLVAVPMNAKLHPDEFAYMFHNSGARLGFATPDLVEAVAGTGALERVVEVPSRDYAKLLEHEPVPMVDRAGDDPAWLFYTSGTTGRPKGATISHRNINAMCGCYFTDVDPSGPWNAILHAAPMSHGSGLYGVAHVLQASCHVIPESAGFTPAEIYELIEHYPGVSF
ncbi:MAG: acyl--CoA ligase, partial [Ottowia sp.]|nr:acyl--CoA ligase [Ottowia sp.]